MTASSMPSYGPIAHSGAAIGYPIRNPPRSSLRPCSSRSRASPPARYWTASRVPLANPSGLRGCPRVLRGLSYFQRPVRLLAVTKLLHQRTTDLLQTAGLVRGPMRPIGKSLTGTGMAALPQKVFIEVGREATVREAGNELQKIREAPRSWHSSCGSTGLESRRIERR